MNPSDPGSRGRASAQALLRYQVTSQVRALVLREGIPLAHAVREVAKLEHLGLDGTSRRVSRRSIYRWLAALEKRGICGLEPARRAGTPSSAALPRELLGFLAEQKRVDPRVSIPEAIRRARELGILHPSHKVDRITVWRACRRMGLPVKRRKKERKRLQARRFAYAHRMEMVLCDGKHFRAGAARAKRVALVFLDDATRMGLHAAVGTSETTELFLRGLYETIRRFGLMSILYLDHGPGFISGDTIDVIARLGVLLIHGEAGYPQGHGKIERFNRTMLAALLRGFDRRPDVDPACGALQVRLGHYLEQIYNHTPHEGIAGATPWQRFQGDARPLRYPRSQHDLQRRFLATTERRVSHDNVVSIDSIAYEMPGGHAGQKVTLHRRLLEGGIVFLHQGRLIELHPVDLADNARTRRGRPDPRQPEDLDHPLPKSAADLAFERDHGPVVGPDGGYEDPEEPTEKKEHGFDEGLS